MNDVQLSAPPGASTYTGVHKNARTQIEVHIYDDAQCEVVQFDDSDWKRGLESARDKGHVTWVNVIGLNVHETMRGLSTYLELSPMVSEDIVHVSQYSKVEVHDTYLFSIFKMVYMRGEKILHEHLSMVLTEEMVVTFQENPGDVFDGVRRRLLDPKSVLRSKGADYLYYTLVDALVDHELYTVSTLGAETDALEQDLLDDQSLPLDRLYHMRKQLLLMRTAVLPLKDILMTLKRSDLKAISPEVKALFWDVGDHVDFTVDRLTVYAALVGGIYETHMLDVSNRMNGVMTVLALFSAVFIPITFLTGFFGMNFKFFPVLNSPMAIPVFILACVVISGGMLLFFKSKKWL